LLLPLLGLSLAVLLLTVLAWPVSALVRRYYGVPYRLSGNDARAHRRVRLAALAVLLTMGTALGFVIALLGDLELTSTTSDFVIVGLRVLAAVVLPLGAAVAVWNAWQVLRSGRRKLAKLWAVQLALACLFLLWIGIAQHVIGFSAGY
jgi:ABC-type nickel/cobalt efflux system permease component RcnA